MSGVISMLIGFVICIAIIAVSSIVLLTALLWVFRKKIDFKNLINSEEWEEKQCEG